MNSESPSEFHVEVVKLGKIVPLPNSDTLSITDVLGGYPSIIKTGTFQEGDLAVYVPIDSLVPTDRPEFAFLAREGKSISRVKAIKLRGTFSQGLLVKPLEGMVDGQEVAEAYGVTKYEPPVEVEVESLGANNPLPKQKVRPAPIYGVEAWKRNKTAFIEGETVLALEKVHGCNASYIYTHGKFYVSSHKVLRSVSYGVMTEFFVRLWLWVKTIFGVKHRGHLVRDTGNIWAKMADEYNLKEILQNYPGYALYCEIYGDKVQYLKYGCGPGERRLVVFDMLDTKTGKYMAWEDLRTFCIKHSLQHAPVVYKGPYGPETPKLAEGMSLMPEANHIREGVCIRCIPERRSPTVGRAHLKVVSEAYLLNKDT